MKHRYDIPKYSWVEWLRMHIVTGAYIPETWDRRKAFPYNGLLISAIYLQEARDLCQKGNRDRVWHILAMAYYHLGQNAQKSTLRNTARAAEMMHAARTEKIRVLVFHALDRIRRDGSASSIDQAKDQVMDLIRERQDHETVKEWLKEFDASVSKNVKGRTEARDKNDVIQRIRNLLDTWCLPSGPYPEIAEAFSQFSARKRKMKPSSADAEATKQDAPDGESMCYLRTVSFFEDGRPIISSFWE